MESLLAAFGAVLLFFGLFGVFSGSDPLLVGMHVLGGLVLLGWAGARSFRRVAELASSSTAKGGLNAVVQALLVVVIGALVAFLSTRYSKHWDWTEAKEHTLAQGTVDTLAAIPADGQIDIIGFYTRGNETPAKAELDKYEHASSRVHVRYLDPDHNPGLAQKFQVASKEGMVVVCNGPCETAKGTVKAVDVTEQSLTRAIRQAVSSKKKVYWVQGHGEVDPDETKGAGGSGVKGGLEDENASVAKLVLAGQTEIPADADALIIAGPDKAYSEGELALLDAYLKRGGSVFMMVDPDHETNLEGELAKWGITAGPEVIVEQQVQLFQGPSLGVQPVVTKYAPHPITDKLNGQPTIFRLARPVRKTDPNDPELTELATTSPQSWGESDVKDLLAAKPMALDPSKDKPGPLSIAVAREFKVEGKRSGRLVVIGDSDFMRNRYVTQVYNGDLFLNAASWLVGSEEFATIDRKRPRVTMATLTQVQFANFRFMALFLLPEAILMLGIVNWWRRKT